MSHRRRGISKKVRYGILARDLFMCRYCGAQADAGAVLVVDHIIPVAQGGTNDDENLITACEPCNQGKGARSPVTAAPTNRDLERLAESVARQKASAELVAKLAADREALRQDLVNMWCEIRDVDDIGHETLRSMEFWQKEVGTERLYQWIVIAERRHPEWSDRQLCRYIGGIRRREREQAEEKRLREEGRWPACRYVPEKEATTDDR